MTLYTFLTVFLIAWAIAVLVMNWKRNRTFENNQAEIERLHQRIEVTCPPETGPHLE
jgi:hypothetical protein